MDDFTQHIAVLSTAVFIPAAQSLKQKRMVLKSLKDRIRRKFNVSIAELDGQDKWQRAILGIVMIGNDNRYMNGCLENILSLINASPELEVCEHQIEFC